MVFVDLGSEGVKTLLPTMFGKHSLFDLEEYIIRVAVRIPNGNEGGNG